MIKTQAQLLADINAVLAGTPKIRASLHRQLEIDIVDTFSNPKIWRGLLTQTGTNAPTVTELQNPIGSITWAYNSTGQFTGTLAGAFANAYSPQDQTGAICVNDDTNYYIYATATSSDVFTIVTRNESLAPSNNRLQSKLIEIYVYP